LRKEEGFKNGFRKGKAQGLKRGREEGWKEGWEEAYNDELEFAVKNITEPILQEVTPDFSGRVKPVWEKRRAPFCSCWGRNNARRG